MIPSDYVVTKVLQYTKRPLKLKYKNGYNFECPICNEGNSSGKKRRGYYMPDNGFIYCHNCNQGWDPAKWIQQVCNIGYRDILEEIKEYEYVTPQSIIDIDTPRKKITFSTLPEDSINLLDQQQVKYYQNESVVRQALALIKERKLEVAVNRPKSLWISLKDFVHKNRLVIPFYDEDNQIRFYQSRTVLIEEMKDKPKYLSKLNADKRIYGINAIDPSLNYLFIFEGPIDSMFVKNGIAICGLHMTNLQQSMLNKFFLYEQIWVLDNQFVDEAGKNKTLQLIDAGARVFIWPKELRNCKDINDVCIKYNLNEVSAKFIIDNSYSGLEAKVRLNVT